MFEKIFVFWGSTREFNRFLDQSISVSDKTVTLVEVIQHYNARIRPSDSGVQEYQLAKKICADNCVVRTDDYGSVLEHVLSNFASIITRNYKIKKLYVQNPPKRVINGLYAEYSDVIEIKKQEYVEVDRQKLKEIYSNLNADVLGQKACKRDLISGIYKLTAAKVNRPTVLLLYGPSGVGKTETAKSISTSLGGKLLRIQFSMMQTQEAFDYIFGAEHSKASFARDMLGRESDVILIDEFDKVNPRFYNAFYELFDEGVYTDIHYSTELKKTIFILTCNFMTEAEIKLALGPAMFSRIGCCIKYSDLSKEQKCKIIQKYYDDTIAVLKQDEKELIQKSDILQWFINNAGRYDNIRTLKLKLENAIFGELTDSFIISPSKN